MGDKDFSLRVGGHVVPLELNEVVNLAVQLEGSLGLELTLRIGGETLATERFYTVWVGSDGQRIERVHQAPIGVLTPLDVDDVPEADLLATIDFEKTLEALTVTVERAEGVTGVLCVFVEAIVAIPGDAGLAHKMVALNDDERAWPATLHSGQQRRDASRAEFQQRSGA